MMMLPIAMLNGWLFTINDRRIRNAQAREAVLLYKKECYQALADYWQSKNTKLQPAQNNLALTPDINPLIETITNAINQQMVVISRSDLLDLWRPIECAIKKLQDAQTFLETANQRRKELEQKYNAKILMSSNN